MTADTWREWGVERPSGLVCVCRSRAAEPTLLLTLRRGRGVCVREIHATVTARRNGSMKRMVIVDICAGKKRPKPAVKRGRKMGEGWAESGLIAPL